MEQEVEESSKDVIETTENENGPSVFQVDRDRIESIAIENQSEELRALGITVYDQSKFEEGILRQVDHALEEQERKKETTKKKKLLRKHEDPKAASIPATVNQKEETEKEKLIRLGHMTPFGTILNGNKSSQELTSFEKYLLEQEKLRNEKSKSTSNKGKALKTIISNKSITPEKNSNKKIELSFNKNVPKKVKHKSNAVNSDSDYVPSDEDTHKPHSTKLTHNRKRKVEENPDEWKTDDSDWEYSDDEKTRKKKKSKKTDRVIDDGNAQDYSERLTKFETFENEIVDYEEFEGGYRIPYFIWNQLYNYQKVINQIDLQANLSY